MIYRIWYSTESFADYVIENTQLKHAHCVKKKMYESDANNAKNFHTMPDHIKKILYLDAPDLIVELNHEPIFSVEVSTEAGTGHNSFQRFARLAASVENNVPAFYIYPEAKIVTREDTQPVWDKINPLIFQALDDVMNIYGIPALLYYYPSDFNQYPDATTSPLLSNKGLKADLTYSASPLSSDSEMQAMFAAMDEVIDDFKKYGIAKGREKLLSNRQIMSHRQKMQQAFHTKRQGKGIESMSPLSATITIPSSYLLNYLSKYEDRDYQIGELLRNREETVIYQVNAGFRGDPYPGALAAIDYLKCREGKSFEERRYNLVLAWAQIEVDNDNQTIKLTGKGDINDFFSSVQSSENKNILSKKYSELAKQEIPRYYMQVRYGSTYSKVKHIRVFSYFSDAILFPNGALWRDA